MFKKVIPYVLAVIVFIAALVLLRPAPSKMVVVAAHDLRAGHTMVEGDLSLQAMPANAVASDALTDTQRAIGQSLRIDREQGDIIRTSNLGELITLQSNERAVAVKITDATGLAGLLLPGQEVGVVATIPIQSLNEQGTYSKATIEGLKVMYVDPRFSATDSTDSSQPVNGTSSAGSLIGTSGIATTNDRAQQGFVVLAVPTGLQTVLYDFRASNAVSETRFVNVLELLAALDSTDGATVTLYLMPGENAAQFTSPGLWLPDLVVTPQPTQTPTARP